MKYLKTIERVFGYLAKDHNAEVRKTPNGVLWFHDTELEELYVLKDSSTLVVKNRITGEINTIAIPKPPPGGWEPDEVEE